MPEDAAPELVDRHRTGRRPSPCPAPGKKPTHRGGYSCAYDITPDDSPIFEQSEEVAGFLQHVRLEWTGHAAGPRGRRSNGGVNYNGQH